MQERRSGQRREVTGSRGSTTRDQHQEMVVVEEQEGMSSVASPSPREVHSDLVHLPTFQYILGSSGVVSVKRNGGSYSLEPERPG